MNFTSISDGLIAYRLGLLQLMLGTRKYSCFDNVFFGTVFLSVIGVSPIVFGVFFGLQFLLGTSSSG